MDLQSLECNRQADYILLILAMRLEVPKVISKMLRLLDGIKIAATIGVRTPWTAKNIPMIL